MRDFKKVINELEFSIADLLLFEVFLNTTLIFLIIFLVASLINFYPLMLSIVPAVLYFVYGVIKKFRTNKIYRVENQYPNLKEKLRTAADHSEEHNTIIQILQDDIINTLKGVKLSSFISVKDIFFKIIISIMLCFIIIYLASMHIVFFDTEYGILLAKQNVNDLIGSIADINNPGESAEEVLESLTIDNSTVGGDNDGGDIFGDKSLAELGNKEIELQIKNSNLEYDITKEGEFEDDKFYEDTFPFEIEASSAEAFSESVSANDREIVKEYFTRIAKG